MVDGIEVEACPLRPRDRPFAFVPQDEAIDVAYLQLHARLLRPAVVEVFEKVVEEALLQLDAVVGVEMGPMLEAMRLQPFVLRCSAHKTFEIAAWVQALPTPIRGGQKRHRDLVPHHRSGTVIVIVLRMRADLVAEVATALVELAIRKRLVAADQRARDATLGTAFAATVLHRRHLHVVPVRPERAQDSAVVGHVAIPVGGAFPDAHRRKMRRLQRRHVPLIDAVVRNPAQSHFAVRPRLHARPLDAVIEVAGLARREMVDIAGRTARAA